MHQELNKFLRHYRATPHTSTGKPPAEILFNRPYNTRLPTFRAQAEDNTLRSKDKESKQKQKRYKDSKPYVRPHSISLGDRVLLKNQGHTKLPYDPHPFTVVKIRGHQITATRNGQKRTRNAKKFKHIPYNKQAL